MTHAYKYGSFEKVNEFLSFREKLKNSFHYSLVTIEHLIHDIIHLPSHDLTVQVTFIDRCLPYFELARYECYLCKVSFQTAQHISINPEKPVAELDHLVDNRDIYLFMSFDPDSRYVYIWSSVFKSQLLKVHAVDLDQCFPNILIS